MIWSAFGLLTIIDVAAVYIVGRTAIVGFYFAIAILAWTVLVWSPLILRSRRIRRENGWPLEWDTHERPEDER